jgi:hypothetical protein
MVQSDGTDTEQGRLFEPRRTPRRIDRRRVLPSKEQRELGLAHVRKLREHLANLDDAA